MSDQQFEGFDLNAMLEQAQAMQSRLMQVQEELAEATVEGSTGGVTVTVSGTGELMGVTVEAGRFDGQDQESLTDLGDLVVAAYRDAKTRSDALAAQQLGPLAGGLGSELGLGGEAGGGQEPGALGFGGGGFSPGV